MDSLSENIGDQILQKKIDTLILEVMKDTREQLLQTEERLETKIRNLLNEVETKEAMHKEEIIHLTEEIKELREKFGTDSVKGIDLKCNSSHRLTDGFIENEPAPNDTGRKNQTDGNSFNSGHIESERSVTSDLSLKGVTNNDEFNDRIDLEGNPRHRLTDGSIENEPAPYDGGRDNRKDGIPFDSTKLLGSDEINNMHTSESFHMYSASTISDPSNTSGKVWLITITSVVITMMQFLVLNTLMIEVGNPTCVSHQDCRVGEFCDYNMESHKWTPRCSDCAHINNYIQDNNISNCSSVLDEYKDMSHTHYADVDHMNIAWEVNFDYTKIEDVCFAHFHCSQTDLLEDRCDYIVHELNKIHPTQVFTLIFMSLLLAVLISKDIQDAIAEEVYLNHGLSCGSIKPSGQFAAEVLRMALRARQIVIPWYVGVSAVSIIITDTIDTKNIMLNLLTIDIILIADDLLATLFLPLLDQSSTEKLMKSVSHHKVKVPMVWSRMHGILVAIFLVIAVLFFEPLLISFAPNSYVICSGVFLSYSTIITMNLLCVTFLHGVGHMVLDRKSATKCKAIMRGIGEIIWDLVSYMFFGPLASYVITISIYQDDYGTFQFLCIGIAFLFCFISFKVLKLYTSWQPIQVLSLNLFGM